MHLANAHLKAVSSQNHAADCLEEEQQEAKAGRLESANDLKMQAQEYDKKWDEYKKEKEKCTMLLRKSEDQNWLDLNWRSLEFESFNEQMLFS